MIDVATLSDLWMPFPGGAERLTFNLSRSLADRGLDVRALTEYARRQQFDGVEVDWREIGVFDNREQGWQAISKWLAQHQPKVILTHHLFMSEFGDRLIDTGTPVIQLVYHGHRHPGAELAIFISDFARNNSDLVREGDLTIRPLAMPDCVADEHGDAIGFIKPIPHKGVELVYSLAEALPKRKFVILRGEWQTLETIRDDLPNVEYLEPVDDIRDFYKRVRLVLMPSLTEDAGTVPQECALNRIPCISSAAGGLPEVNGGIIVNSQVPARWIRHIQRCDLQDRADAVVQSQLERMGQLDQTGNLDQLAIRVRELCS